MRITHEDFINRFKECHGNSDPSPSQSSDPFVSLKLKLSSKHLLRFLFLLYSSLQPEFYTVCHTKADYDEHGPSICRHNPVFGAMS